MNRLLAWGIGGPVALLTAVFAISNRGLVHIDLWPLPVDPLPLPLFLAVLLPFALGAFAGAGLLRLAAAPARRRLREQARRIESLERQLGAIRGRPNGGE